MSFNMYLVRHGETYFNKYQRMQGWGNAPLTDKGISDGFAAGERLSNVRFSCLSLHVTTARHQSEVIIRKDVFKEFFGKPFIRIFCVIIINIHD